MALADIIRSGIKIASKITDSLKGDVTFRAWIGQTGDGTDQFADAVTLRALIDPTKKLRASPSGQIIMTFATLTFLDAVEDTTPNTGHTREQPIDPRDLLVLPDGGTAPVVDTGAFMDPATSRGFFGKVTLGSIVRGS